MFARACAFYVCVCVPETRASKTFNCLMLCVCCAESMYMCSYYVRKMRVQSAQQISYYSTIEVFACMMNYANVSRGSSMAVRVGLKYNAIVYESVLFQCFKRDFKFVF